MYDLGPPHRDGDYVVPSVRGKQAAMGQRTKSDLHSWFCLFNTAPFVVIDGGASSDKKGENKPDR